MRSHASLKYRSISLQLTIHTSTRTCGYTSPLSSTCGKPHHNPWNRRVGIAPVASSYAVLATHSHAFSSDSQLFQHFRRSRTSLPLASVPVLFIAGSLVLALFFCESDTTQEAGDQPQPRYMAQPQTSAMAADILPGRPGNLTQDQEDSLRRLWTSVLHICRVGEDNPSGVMSSTDVNSDSLQPRAEKVKKKRSTFFGRLGNATPKADTTGSVTSGNVSSGEFDADDKYGQNRQFVETLARQSPESIRQTIWSMVKHDNPDALLLRFLRARKWDVEKALVMLISTMNWRATEMHVDDDIMKCGEGAAAEAEKDENESAKSLGHDFLAQIRMGKSFLHGLDRAGRPICFVRVRLHRQGEHSEEALERYTVYIIETARMLLKPPIDTATVLFDMTGFSMANMDYAPVKFMIKCFEANYPESLGTVLVYKAPWIFQGIWRIIRGWLDPVVASKVHFVNNADEMAGYVDLDRLPKEVDGKEDWEYRYAEPIEGENTHMADTVSRDRLLKARWRLVEQYEQATLNWVQSDDAEAAANYKATRAATAEKLRVNYWELDPYLRARSLYDRLGMIKPGGVVDPYPSEAINAVNTTGETSPDDVD